MDHKDLIIFFHFDSAISCLHARKVRKKGVIWKEVRSVMASWMEVHLKKSLSLDVIRHCFSNYFLSSSQVCHEKIDDTLNLE